METWKRCGRGGGLGGFGGFGGGEEEERAREEGRIERWKRGSWVRWNSRGWKKGRVRWNSMGRARDRRRWGEETRGSAKQRD